MVAGALLLSLLVAPLAWGLQSPSAGGAPAPILSGPDLREVFERAQRALTAKDYPSAESGFKEFLKLDPNSAAAYTNLGVVYLRTGRFAQASRALETAKKLDPQMVGVDLNLGIAHYRMQDFRRAIPYFQRVLAADPNSVQAHYLLGMCHFMLREYAAQLAALEPIRDQGKDDLDFSVHARHRLWPTEAQ